MEQKDRFDACLGLAEFSSKNFHGRREFEYRVTLAYWTLLAAAIVVVGHAPDDIPKSVPRWAAIGSVLAYTFLWVRGTWVANENDRISANHFRNAAEKIIHDPDYVPAEQPTKIGVCDHRWWFGFLGSLPRWFQLLTSAALATILFFAMPISN
jgi:hypothetical protein